MSFSLNKYELMDQWLRQFIVSLVTWVLQNSLQPFFHVLSQAAEYALLAGQIVLCKKSLYKI